MGLTQLDGRRVRVRVDLTGSKLGQGWLSCDLDLDTPDEWDDDRIRLEASRYYEVPVEQVGQPRNRR